MRSGKESNCNGWAVVVSLLCVVCVVVFFRVSLTVFEPTQPEEELSWSEAIRQQKSILFGKRMELLKLREQLKKLGVDKQLLNEKKMERLGHVIGRISSFLQQTRHQHTSELVSLPEGPALQRLRKKREQQQQGLVEQPERMGVGEMARREEIEGRDSVWEGRKNEGEETTNIVLFTTARPLLFGDPHSIQIAKIWDSVVGVFDPHNDRYRSEFADIRVDFVYFSESEETIQELSKHTSYLHFTSLFDYNFCYNDPIDTEYNGSCQYRGINWPSMWDYVLRSYPETDVVVFLNGDIIFDETFLTTAHQVRRINYNNQSRFCLGSLRVDVKLKTDKANNLLDQIYSAQKPVSSLRKYAQLGRHIGGGVDIAACSIEMIKSLQPFPHFIYPLVCADNWFVAQAHSCGLLIDSDPTSQVFHIAHERAGFPKLQHRYNCGIRREKRCPAPNSFYQNW
eukprot:CAMPEP_0174274268 /NCGR_PEP_ID=MMETSP0439-20130205/57390_1 /TAXON_ID=0 /ORGANISM="Stereomyxa ramosa, Strain Chinc5" /LENGTH=452 /DNA_ID=CAMNT_0015365925 /DNA_START=16 /DNA_END=1371 /DNA_ORIENTATION=-